MTTNMLRVVSSVVLLLVIHHTKQACNIPLDASNWSTVFNGNNYVDGVVYANNRVYLKPTAYNAPWDSRDSSGNLNATSACLLASSVTARDYELNITARTIQQLRTGYPPRSWETFWVVFNYRRITVASGPEEHEWNDFIFKPATSYSGDVGGVEFGIAQQLLGQTFIGTSSQPVLTLNRNYTYTVRKIGRTFDIFIDGVRADIYATINGTYTRIGFPITSQDAYDIIGHIGLYTEDAYVEVSCVNLQSYDANTTATPTPTPTAITSTATPTSSSPTSTTAAATTASPNITTTKSPNSSSKSSSVSYLLILLCMLLQLANNNGYILSLKN